MLRQDSLYIFQKSIYASTFPGIEIWVSADLMWLIHYRLFSFQGLFFVNSEYQKHNCNIALYRSGEDKHAYDSKP